MKRNVFLAILALIPVLLFRYGLTRSPHGDEPVVLSNTSAIETPRAFEQAGNLPSERPSTPRQMHSVTPGNRMSRVNRSTGSRFNEDIPLDGSEMMDDDSGMGQNSGMMGQGSGAMGGSSGMMGQGSGMGRGMGGFAGSILGSILRSLLGGGGHMGMGM